MAVAPKVEGFTHAEIAEFEAAFQAAVSEQATMSAPSGARDEARGLDTLAVGRVLRWFGISTNLQQVHQLLEELDFDNSGLIEFTEFIKMMRRLYQDHANQVRFLFNKLDRQRSGLIPVSELPNAVLVFEGALGDPDLVATARAQAKLPETGFVDRPGFEEFFRQWRKVAIDQVRARAGYSTLEVSRLREAFQTIDREPRQWTTAQSKVYPEPLCRLLASAMLSAIHLAFPSCHGSSVDWELHEWAADFFIPLDRYMDHAMANDCMAHRDAG
ncbi:unnamed protein product [Prorocentrum cordatum]|uniref:EF-hand domain-containing protein n=1 Tax=Prorocentrum cordatum TaxID=2364126 RepID=A0ABN9XPP0_9DINO|nr:unnamed protein product [Polarella glacialis]